MKVVFFICLFKLTVWLKFYLFLKNQMQLSRTTVNTNLFEVIKIHLRG